MDTENKARISRIMAGPGTGKTYNLVKRIEALLKGGADPQRILLVTFTRTSALDLVKELRTLKTPHAQLIHSDTLHSFSLHILHKAEYFLTHGRETRILMEFELRFLLEDLSGNVRELGKKLKAFEAAWARDQEQEPGWALDPSDKEFEQELSSWLLFHKAMLISEIIPLTLRYLRDNPASPILKDYEHVFVDEYQDLNKAEQSLINLIRRAANLTVVGDEDQSIYQDFRHAHPEGITAFHTVYPDTVDEGLDVCRRCPQLVVEIANSLISNNKRRADKELKPFPTNATGEIHIVQWSDIPNEARGIATYIYEQIQKGQFEPGEILILCPRKQFGIAIKEALAELNCPAHSFFREEVFSGDPKKLTSSRTKEAFTLLQLAANYFDRPALRAWLGYGSTDLGKKQYKVLRRYCEQTGKNPIEVLAQLDNGIIDDIGGKIDKLIIRFRVLNEKLDYFKSKKPIEVFEEIFPKHEDWAKPFHAMAGDIDEETSLGEIIEHIRTEVSQPEMPTDAEYVRIMSLHKSKGLSAKLVIVTGFIQGLIPSLGDDKLSEEAKDIYLEEQRRLLYVAITRTKHTLVLSSVASIPRNELHNMRAVTPKGGTKSHAYTITSSFLRELGPSCPNPVTGARWDYQ
ncbi:MAG: ATP-dependent helicase [Anaerolineae bacterium]|nr:ATP-dependent helicase [Anaerolineae bacterium]